MAYGESASVTLLVGGTSVFFTTANITTAISLADVEVDNINASASDSQKTAASNLLASDLLLVANANRLTGGLASSRQTNGQPAYNFAGGVGCRAEALAKAKELLRTKRFMSSTSVSTKDYYDSDTSSQETPI